MPSPVLHGRGRNMARSDARGVGPVLFDRDWSRVSGSWQGLSNGAQMVRAARGYSPAIFKPISKGGCYTGAQLKAQLSYLTTKSSHILDSRGTHDGKTRLTEAEIDRVVRRFTNQWDERYSPKLGHTTHLLMAFPIGTSGDEVRAITESVCERFFQGEGSQFDYIAAIHLDRAHPHVHVVLNRRSKDGEMFFLGKDHHFNYDAFRVAMVEAAQVHGIRLEATRRLDRGVTTYRAEIDEIYKARDEGRPPVERERTGSDLASALKAVAHSAQTFRGLAAEASRSNFDDVAEALERASTILASGGQIQSDGVIYMSQDETAFDTLLTEFSHNVRQIEAAIERAPAAERPEIERKLTDVLTSVAHLNPLGDRSAALLYAPSRDGVYVRANLREGQVERLDDDAVKARLGEALQGTGIDPEAVGARMREGADNAALERQWLAQDLRAIAKAGGLDLEAGEDREEALDRLEAVHVRLGDTLTDAGLLRTADDMEEVEDDDAALSERVKLPQHALAEEEPSVFERSERRDFQDLVAQLRRTDFNEAVSQDPDSDARRLGPSEAQAARAAFNEYAQRSPAHAELASIAWERVVGTREAPEHGVETKDRTLHAGDMELALRDPEDHLAPVTEEMRTVALYRTEMLDDEFEAAIQGEIKHLRAQGASSAYICERSFEIEDGVRQDYAERRYLEETTPTVTAWLRRAASDDAAVVSGDDGQRMVEQIDRSLTRDELAALRAGDAEVLDKFTEHPLRQLELARIYLQNNETTAHGPAMERVLDALAQEQVGARRAHHAAVHGEKGITHG